MKTANITITSPNTSRYAKQIIIPFLLLGFTILFLGSCTKNNGIDVLEEQFFDGLDFEAEIIENREEALLTSIINGGSGGYIYGLKGTELYFPPNRFLDQNGDLVTGTVTIELIEIYDKANMLLTNMPTNGRLPNGDIETLVSGGEFFINATQNGEQLTLVNGFKIFAPADELDENMRLFNGNNDECADTTIMCDIVWEEGEQDGIGPTQREGADGQIINGYRGTISNFGWTNIDRWYSDPRPKTTLYVDPPTGYDNTNCNIYVSYDGETALALLDIYNDETGLFSEHYGQIPIGLEVHFIFVSVQDALYQYTIQGVTIGEDHLEIIDTPASGTEADLIALINALP